MNKEDSNVAELLQQLEELKRKKAQKLLKLQKLGRRSGRLSLSGSHQEKHSEESPISNRTISLSECSQENKAVNKIIKQKCPKCNSTLKADNFCSLCNCSNSVADKTKLSKCTLPLHSRNLENQTKTQLTSRQASCKLQKKSDGRESVLGSNDRTFCENNANIVPSSQISSDFTLEKSANLLKNDESVLKYSIHDEEIFSSAGQRPSSISERATKSIDSVKLKTHSSFVDEVYNVKNIDFGIKDSSLEKEAVDDISEKKAELLISTCYETGIHQNSKQRKRSSSISEKEDPHDCEAKKMRLSNEINVVSERTNECNESSFSIFEENCLENVIKQKGSLDEKSMNFSPEKSKDKGPDAKAESVSSNISGLLSGSFAVEGNEDNSLNPSSENVKTVEALKRDDYESSEKNCGISSSMRLSSPFSDELNFPVALENVPGGSCATKEQFSSPESHQNVDENSSCNVFLPGDENTECAAIDFKDKGMSECKNGYNEMRVKPLESFKYKPESPACAVPDEAQDSEVIESTEGLITVVESHSKQGLEDIEVNLTPSLLDSFTDVHVKDVELDGDPERKDSITLSKTSNNFTVNQSQNEVDCNAQTADLEFDSVSLVGVDIVEDTIQDANSSVLAFRQKDDSLFKVPSIPAEPNDNEFCIPDSELFTIPETEMIAPVEEYTNFDKNRMSVECSKKCDSPLHSQILESNLRDVEGNENFSKSGVTHDPKSSDPFEDTAFLDDSFSESLAKMEQYDNFQDTLIVEDTLELGNYKNIPFLSNENSTDGSLEVTETKEDSSSSIKFVCCVHSEVKEPVRDVKIALFNRCYYTFVKFSKYILVCKLEGRHWNKIFSHEVEETFQLNEMCFTQNDTFLVLVMLLKSDKGNCLQFVLFEKDTKIIKLMEHTHWLQSSFSGDSVLLCGLDSLKFSTAVGGDGFEVFVHAFSCLHSNPRLLSASLGTSVAGLHSLCPIENLPNAMIGLSSSVLYVWHLVETRLVTSVSLQPEDVMPIEKCFWAVIENGLTYFLTLCGDLSSYACQLFVANLATGFCQLASPYNVIPATESKLLKKRNLSAVYSQPFLVASCSDGCFLWSIDDEYCSASLGNDVNASTVAIVPKNGDCYLIAIGTDEGIVNFYDLKCS